MEEHTPSPIREPPPFFSGKVFLVLAAHSLFAAHLEGSELPWLSPNRYRLLMRVDPLRLRRSNSPVSLEVNLATVLRDAGITGALDEGTIEVMGFNSLGIPAVFDASRDGYERYLLPWRLEADSGTTLKTLRFVMPDEEYIRYAIYLDTVDCGRGQPRRPSLVGDGDLKDAIRGTHPRVRLERFEAAKPDFLGVVRRYADFMIEHGRDLYGEERSSLFLSALDRTTLKPLEVRPAPPGGIRREDRSGLPWRRLSGANPQLDQNLLRVLYCLTELTGERRYREAADHEVKWFFENTQSAATGLFPWGEHLSWDVFLDKPVSSSTDLTHEFARPWVLWERSYALAPQAALRFALGLWNHQVADQKTGGFDRHAPYNRHGPEDGKDFPRHAGFYIDAWAHAYEHSRDGVFLQAIETLLKRFERKRFDASGAAHATIGPLDVYRAAALVPEPLASRLSSFAEGEDRLILEDLRSQHGRPEGTWSFRPTWQAGYSSGVTADWAVFALARHEQVKKTEFRDLLLAVADAYRDALPAEDVDVWPMSFAHVISAQVAAYRLTARAVYLEQASRFARMAVEVFWQESPLPRASFKTGHYETITGADSLALALLEVHAATLNLKTAIPSNTIDR